MEGLLLKYGYLLLFFGVAVEGETVLLAGSFLAERGYFHLPLVIVTAVVANCTADQIYYQAARARGRAWLETRFGNSDRYRRIIGGVSRHASWLLLVSRFAFGFRILIPAACGVLGMPVLRFTLINLIAGLVWAVPTGLLGFYFGRTSEGLLVRARHYEIWVVAVFLAVAVSVVAVRHLRRTEWFEHLKWADVHAAVPLLIGLMGLLNLVSAIWPRSHRSLAGLERWLPLEVTQPSRPLMLFAGLALLQVTRNLARRKLLAWYVAFFALGVSLVLHVTRAFDLQHSLIAALLMGYLIVFRRRFYGRSDPTSLRRVLWMAPVLELVVVVYGYVGFAEMAHQFRWGAGAHPANQAFAAGVLIREPAIVPRTPPAAWFLASVQVAGWLARLYLLVLLLRPVALRRRQEAPGPEIDRIFRLHSRHSLSAFAVQDDKHHLLVAAGRGLVAYATRSSVAFACGDPLAAEEDFDEAVREYVEHCISNGWIACIYDAAEERVPVYEAAGLRTLKIAEEALIDLGAFTLSGNKRANLRAMVNKAAKTGMRVVAYGAVRTPDIDEQLERISEEWLREKHLGELGFSLGRFSLEGLAGIPVFLAMIDSTVEAFCSWLPYRGGTAVVLDLMRRRSGAGAGTMDFLLAHSLLALRDQGLAEASLANAPLANVGSPRGGLARGVDLLFENMNAFYGYKNLFHFKRKFAPRWEGRFLIYPNGADLPRVAYALTKLHSTEGLLRIFFRG